MGMPLMPLTGITINFMGMPLTNITPITHNASLANAVAGDVSAAMNNTAAFNSALDSAAAGDTVVIPAGLNFYVIGVCACCYYLRLCVSSWPPCL
jgi:hypothetical protein